MIDNDRARSRFVIEQDGSEAELIYRLHGDRLVLVHTEVPEAFRGKGVGGQLVSAAVDLARSQRLTIVPLCPYAKRWLEEHGDVAATVKIDWTAD